MRKSTTAAAMTAFVMTGVVPLALFMSPVTAQSLSSTLCAAALGGAAPCRGAVLTGGARGSRACGRT
mgnify:CR=1 FL=1